MIDEISTAFSSYVASAPPNFCYVDLVPLKQFSQRGHVPSGQHSTISSSRFAHNLLDILWFLLSKVKFYCQNVLFFFLTENDSIFIFFSYRMFFFSSNEVKLAVLNCVGHFIEIDLNLLEHQLESICKIVLTVDKTLEVCSFLQKLSLFDPFDTLSQY